MELIKFDAKRCSLCGKCVEKCPFGALSFEDNGIVVGDTCRMCGMCVRQCPEKAISFEQKAGSFDKDKWKDFLIFVEQERGDIHPHMQRPDQLHSLEVYVHSQWFLLHLRSRI